MSTWEKIYLAVGIIVVCAIIIAWLFQGLRDYD
jgi:hypothetical protein